MKSMSGILRPLLCVPAACYRVVQTAWAAAFSVGVLSSTKASIPVLSVGNIVMGGAGKTPFVVFLAELLKRRGLRPAVVSRGYGGTNRLPYLVVSDGTGKAPRPDPLVVGDEPALIAERLIDIPVLIGRKRIQPVEASARIFGCNVAILDDGFQHLRLARDLDVVILNGSEDRMFPAGRLREPVAALARAHVVALPVGATVSRDVEHTLAASNALTVRFGVLPKALRLGGLSGSTVDPDHFAGKEVALVSGIAEPSRFRKTAETLGWVVTKHHIFPDHHVFTDIQVLDALTANSDTPLVFTEKDWVKLPQSVKQSERLSVLSISVEVDDEDLLWETIARRLPASVLSA